MQPHRRNNTEGKRRPFVHSPAMLAGLEVATRWLTNLARVYEKNKREKIKAIQLFLDCVMETFLTIHTHGP